MSKFVIIAYDKDNDVYEDLYSDTDYQNVLVKAKQYAEQCKASILRRSDNGEPFDWIQIESTITPGKPLWISE